MPSSKITIATAVLVSLLLATEARAELREFRFYEENDVLNPSRDATDRYYTQGIRFEWINGPRDGEVKFLPGITHEDWCRLLCGKGVKSEGFESGHAFGQNMYTPEEIEVAEPQPNDRPWAGYLYGSRIARVVYHDETLDASRQDRLEVSLGIVGPASLAGDTQIWWHDTFGFETDPAGWDNQLRNEPVLQLRYDAAVRWATPKGNADVIPRVRANLGNALVSVEAEVTGRLGWNLSGFGTPSISPAPPPPAFALSGPVNAPARPGWRPKGNVFLRAGIKAVAHNITLDGNTFADNDIRIRRKPFVPEIAAGFEVNPFSKVWLTYQFVHRGSEFKRRNGRDAPPQKFGAITIAWR